MDDVVGGAIRMDVMDLGAVVGFEEAKEFAEEFVDLNNGSIGEAQADPDGR